MSMNTDYTEYMLEQLKCLMDIDSPSGYTGKAAGYLMEEYRRLGYEPVQTVKGGVIVDLGGQKEGNAIFLEAHVDTLGAMVQEIKGNGRLVLSPVGGLPASNVAHENCRIYTRDGRTYTGTFQVNNASLHVNDDYEKADRSYKNMEVVIDADTSSAEETKALGIGNGNYVCFHSRTMVTENGYIKSRYLDDKLSAAILLGYAKYLKDKGITPLRRVYEHLTVYEEVGHGGSASIPEHVTEVLSVDMGCVGETLRCTERQVSICAKDSRGPYTYQVVSDLIAAAESAELDYSVDVYPHYGSDADVALTAGYDVSHGLIGPGVYASHGYERSHVDGMNNAFTLLLTYLE